MSTLVTAAIIIASLAVLFFILITIHNNRKRKAVNTMLQHFSEAGTSQGLNFSGQEVLKDCIFGLDGVQRKVLVITKTERDFAMVLIAVDDIRSCSVKKIYGATHFGDLRKCGADHYLESISLHFELKNGKREQILFYDPLFNSIYEAAGLEHRARDWEIILSKLQMPCKKAG